MILHVSYTSDVISNSSKQFHNIHYIIYTDVISTLDLFDSQNIYDM